MSYRLLFLVVLSEISKLLNFISFARLYIQHFLISKYKKLNLRKKNPILI